MSWTRPTIQEIYKRIKADMESRVTANIEIPRISLLGILNIVFTGGIHLTYGFLVWIFKQIFVDTATSIGRERWSRILGLPQKAAVFTTGNVAFTGAGTVPAGTGFTNSEGYEYTTDGAFTVGVDTSVGATAAGEGENYNTEDTEFTLSSPLPGIDSEVQKVGDGFDNGADIETLESWVLRMLQRFQNPPSSGNKEDYIRWALEIAGVGKAWCFPAEEYMGAGTVGVYVSTDDLEPVPVGVLTEVETYIEEQKPIPAEVDYATINPLGVVFDISLTPNTEELRDAIDQNLDDLFVLESGPGLTVLLSHIRSSIGAAGPDDYDITEITVDGTPIGVNNIETTRPDTAKFESVNYSDLT